MVENGTVRPLEGLEKVHDLLLSHNNISAIEERALGEMESLQTL